MVISTKDFTSAIDTVHACEENTKRLGHVSETYKLIMKVQRSLAHLVAKNGSKEIPLNILMSRVSKYIDKKKLDDVLEQLALERSISIRGRTITVLRDLTGE